MSHNKKALRVDLGKYYKPDPYKKDIITDPAGQWKYPGQPTRIPGNEITMQGVPYPVFGQDDLGYTQMMYPGEEYIFPGNYVDEYPQMKVGGIPELPLNAGRRAYHAWGYTNNDFIVNRQTGGEGTCEDGRCEETDQIQNMLDEGSRIPWNNVGLMWDIVKSQDDNKFVRDVNGSHPIEDADVEWKRRGAKSLAARLPQIENPSSCMWVAGSGYQCLPETKGKIPLGAFESNDKFINAVNKGTVPFSRVAVSHDPNFTDKAKGNLKPGDIINFKGRATSHAMTFSHYREDGQPIFLDSNGNAKNFGANIGLWDELKPGRDTTAYISRFNPEMFYKDKIKALEEKARTNPTMVNQSVGSLPTRPAQPIEEEYKKGGEKKYSRNMGATNRLFHENPITAKKGVKKKIFDPTSKIFQTGGDVYEIAARPGARYMKDAKGNWLIKADGTNNKFIPIQDPTGDRTKLLNAQAYKVDPRILAKENQKKVDWNRIVNLKNELKVLNNEIKNSPVGKFNTQSAESTDTNLKVSSAQEDYNRKVQRAKEIEGYLNSRDQKNAAYKAKMQERETAKNNPLSKEAIAERQAWESRSSGKAQPVDWVWSLPIAGTRAAASAIPELITASNAVLDAPAIIGGTEYSGITAGNLLRGVGANSALMHSPETLHKLKNANTFDEQMNALGDFVGTAISVSPLVKWDNKLYNTLGTPNSFAQNLHKLVKNKDIDPVSGASNAIRTLKLISGRQEGGAQETELTPEQIEWYRSQGYVVEELD
jgi:hypothetical protein